MQEDEKPSSEFVETLRAAAAAVGRPALAIDPQQPASVDEPDPERETRIAALKRRYAEGTYQVNAAEVAAKIVDDHLT